MSQLIIQYTAVTVSHLLLVLVLQYHAHCHCRTQQTTLHLR